MKGEILYINKLKNRDNTPIGTSSPQAIPQQSSWKPQATYQGPALSEHKKHSPSAQAQSRCTLTHTAYEA